eukprot:GHVU01220984.1.p1 GENE.GHVU01220984.1~~GHVU01220984.1.p1  ORF type:complete len:117 (-),score=0.16 GHVU01220984.1:300-650(-)
MGTSQSNKFTTKAMIGTYYLFEGHMTGISEQSAYKVDQDILPEFYIFHKKKSFASTIISPKPHKPGPSNFTRCMSILYAFSGNGVGHVTHVTWSCDTDLNMKKYRIFFNIVLSNLI